MNTLARRMRRELPEVRVERIAYLDTLDPPTRGHEFAPSVVVDFAAIERTYSTDLADESSAPNAAAYGKLLAWAEYDNPVVMYEYLRRYRWRSLPVHPVRVISEDVRTYARLGLGGIGLYSEPADWIPFELTHLLVADAAWDHDATTGYLERYLGDRFGAGAEAMARYFEDTAFDPDRLVQPGNPAKVRDQYAAADAASREARSAVGDDPIRTVLGKLRRNMELARADVDISYYAARGDEQAERAAKRRYQHLAELHRFDGIVVLDDRVTQRYGAGSSRKGIAAMYWARAWGSLSATELTIRPGQMAVLAVRAQEGDYQGHRVDWAASPPAEVSMSVESGVLDVNGPGFAQMNITVSLDAGSVGEQDRVPFRFTADGTEVTAIELTVVGARE